jgi:hypothetical protein
MARLAAALEAKRAAEAPAAPDVSDEQPDPEPEPAAPAAE